MNRLKRTIKKMQHDSAINRVSGLYVLVPGIPSFAPYYPEIKEVVSLVANDVHVDQG